MTPFPAHISGEASAGPVSILIPLHNEAENVPLLAEAVDAVFSDAGRAYELIFVNDGSTDGTAQALRETMAVYPAVRAIRFSENRGQSAALLTGMHHARGALIVTLDGDLQNDPADIPQVLALLEDYDCAFGCRVGRNDGLIRVLVSKVANPILRALTGNHLKDAGCGLKGFRRECIAYLPPFNGVHRFFGTMLLHAGFRLVECPISHHARRHGVSKYGILNRLGHVLFDIFGVIWMRRRYLPLETFGAEEQVHQVVPAPKRKTG
jgi:dolichol-phosphate mannosyltransferase